MAKLDLAAPWTTYYRQLQSFFKKDEEVKVIFDNQTASIKIFVENPTKADALTLLLPTAKTFGNVTVNVSVIPANNAERKEELDPKNHQQLFTHALNGNKAISFIQEVGFMGNQKFMYVVFDKEVVQFYNDDISDIRGLCHTLYQDIANTIFEKHAGVFFCTDIDKTNASLGQPLGEWP